MKRSLKSLIDHLSTSDADKVQRSSCLECGTALTSRGQHLQVCTECQGLWVTPKAFDALVDAPHKALGDLLGVSAESTNTHQPSRQGRSCPTCGQTMNNYQFQGLWLDACHHGHGVWLDPGELELLRKASLVNR